MKAHPILLFRYLDLDAAHAASLTARPILAPLTCCLPQMYCVMWGFWTNITEPIILFDDPPPPPPEDQQALSVPGDPMQHCKPTCNQTYCLWYLGFF